MDGDEEDSVVYGELAIIGFNGAHELPDLGPRRCTKIVFRKRPIANGTCPGPISSHPSREQSVAVCNRETHSVSYTLSRQETVVVEYVPEPTHDMFQIGRSTNKHIDFVITEPCNRLDNPKPSSSTESAVSRFACRIHIDREPPHTARIYAAGFDHANNIVLGELGVKWKWGKQMDGLTTNGVLILRPPTSSLLSANNGSTNPSGTGEKESHSQWREVTICGAIYGIRDRRSVPSAGNRLDEDNLLRDKTLIDLCGVTLFWRSAEGLSTSANSWDLKLMIDGINMARFQCPITYHTLHMCCTESSKRPHLPTPSQKAMVTLFEDAAVGPTTAVPGAPKSEPYVYLRCGHVHGWHTWDNSNANTNRTCSLCLQISPFVRLSIGLEPAFHVDRSALMTHCFSPCGHMASERTIRFWCSIPLPTVHSTKYKPRCPFCLSPVDPQPVRLLFQGDTDSETLVDLINATILHGTLNKRAVLFRQSPLPEEEAIVP